MDWVGKKWRALDRLNPDQQGICSATLSLLLAEHFLRRYAESHGLVPKRVSGAAEVWLRGYHWPGNVRELSHLMERVTLLSSEAILTPDTLDRLCLPPAAAVGASGS